MDMISGELKTVLLTALGLDDWDIREETTATEIPGWDSLKHVDIILAVEEYFRVRFKSTEVLKLKNIGDLQRLVTSKVGKADLH
jgi:acyl carrier protein